jgi:hypothetical protein
LAIFVVLALPLIARAERDCRDDLEEADGYTIRSVKVEGRWVPPLPLPIKPGDRFSNAKVQAAMGAVRDALRADERREFELQNLGALGVLHITRCLLVEGRNVDVIIEAHSLRVDLFEIGGNVLPVPRSAAATFYNAVPAPILALNPTFGAYQDNEYGFAPSASIATSRVGDRLRIVASGRKSVEHSFYNADAEVTYRSGSIGIEARYSGFDEPRSDESFVRQSGNVGLNLRLHPGRTMLSLGASYRFADDRFGAEDSSEHAAQAYALVDGRAGDAFVRAALWAEAAWPDRGSSYGRVAGIAAIEKEFLIAKNQTVGVEALIGAGHAWAAPEYAQFYGGNTNRDFLYESLDSSWLKRFPNGPLIRSFGEGQALARGARTYWHLNLNISIPVPPLSRPLIPDEEVAPGLTLKQLLKNKAGDSVAYYAVQLESEGVPPKEALRRAQAMYGDVRPAIEFIADRANVFSLKPLVLCDLAGDDDRVRSAVGGGLQLTIVTARMEAGYMQTISGGDSGNFFARIVFQNIF